MWFEPTNLVGVEDRSSGRCFQLGVPTELHVYARGGHGYGMRDTGEYVNTWPRRAADWLNSNHWLEPSR